MVLHGNLILPGLLLALTSLSQGSQNVAASSIEDSGLNVREEYGGDQNQRLLLKMDPYPQLLSVVAPFLLSFAILPPVASLSLQQRLP